MTRAAKRRASGDAKKSSGVPRRTGTPPPVATTTPAVPANVAPGSRPSTGATPSAARRRTSNYSSSMALDPLDPSNAGIPFERIPYVLGDLKRVGVMATIMIVIIILAALFVPHFFG